MPHCRPSTRCRSASRPHRPGAVSSQLQNQIELARREEQLVGQRGQNERQRAHEQAEAQRIEAVAQAERTKVAGQATAEQIRVVEGAKVEAERTRLDAYRDLPTSVILGLAAQELSQNLRIEHLNVTPEMLGPVLSKLLDAGARRGEAG